MDLPVVSPHESWSKLRKVCKLWTELQIKCILNVGASNIPSTYFSFKFNLVPWLIRMAFYRRSWRGQECKNAQNVEGLARFIMIFRRGLKNVRCAEDRVFRTRKAATLANNVSGRELSLSKEPLNAVWHVEDLVKTLFLRDTSVLWILKKSRKNKNVEWNFGFCHLSL